MSSLSIVAIVVAGFAVVAVFVLVRSLRMPAGHEKNQRRRDMLRAQRIELHGREEPTSDE